MIRLKYIVRICRRHMYHRTSVTVWTAKTERGIPVELLVARQKLGPIIESHGAGPYEAWSTTIIEPVGTVGTRVWLSSLVAGQLLSLWVAAILPVRPEDWRRLLLDCSELTETEWRGLRCLA